MSKSGRESLPMAERVALLRSELVVIQASRPTARHSGNYAHDLGCLVGFVGGACHLYEQRGVDTYVTSAELQVMAWRLEHGCTDDKVKR